MYKIVKYCRICRERFVVMKGQNKRIYCDKCEAKQKAEYEAAAKEDKENLDSEKNV